MAKKQNGNLPNGTTNLEHQLHEEPDISFRWTCTDKDISCTHKNLSCTAHPNFFAAILLGMTQCSRACYSALNQPMKPFLKGKGKGIRKSSASDKHLRACQTEIVPDWSNNGKRQRMCMCTFGLPFLTPLYFNSSHYRHWTSSALRRILPCIVS
eukprot:scaffold241213_cov18-Tisochrysis_lutea.AAC.3